MKKLSVVDTQKFELKDEKIPEINKDEVLIKVAYCGICGSDLPRYFDGAVHQFPQTLGHEFSGTIAKLGDSTTNLTINQRVVVAPLVPCQKCDACLQGNPALCNQYSFIGSRRQGAMAEYVAVPAENCLPIPDSLSLKEAALVEPLTVAIHGIEQVPFHAGVTTLVLGCGTIGLMTILSLRARGVGEIIATDINDFKLSKAKECGADTVINPSKISLEEYFHDHQKPLLLIETAGSATTQIQSIELAEKNAKVVFIGTCTKPVHFSAETFELILRKELTLRGSWMSYSTPFPGYEWSAAIRYLTKKQINVSPLITSLHPLEDKNIPFDNMVKNNSKEVKILFEINKEI